MTLEDLERQYLLILLVGLSKKKILPAAAFFRHTHAQSVLIVSYLMIAWVNTTVVRGSVGNAWVVGVMTAGSY